MDCEGNCVEDYGEHEGEVKTFNVVHPQPFKDWGPFDYCENAVKTDIGNGFELTEITESD